MNVTVITLGNLTEKETKFIQLEQKLLSLSNVYKAKLEGNTVHIYLGIAFDEETHQVIDDIFSQGDFSDFEYQIHDYEDEFDLAEKRLRALEEKVRSEISAFTEDPELGKVESVQVVFNTMDRFLRALGFNAEGKRGIVSVSGRTSLESHHALSALRDRFGIPFVLRDVPPTQKD